MSTESTSPEKDTDETVSIDEYSERAAKRAQWESFEFSLGGPGHVKIRNLSYGEAEASEHTYIVQVKAGEAVRCTCPADEYHSGRCKHRLAVEANEAVMQAGEADESAVRAARGME